ncbi:hypothetical protein FQR65_LT16304 [Abscondita terminalis]|nr:hypothetical protein FQR65_LT16304 [Abscondita terminalis]
MNVSKRKPRNVARKKGGLNPAIVIPILLVIGIAIYVFILGNTGNFKADPALDGEASVALANIEAKKLHPESFLWEIIYWEDRLYQSLLTFILLLSFSLREILFINSVQAVQEDVPGCQLPLSIGISEPLINTALHFGTSALQLFLTTSLLLRSMELTYKIDESERKSVKGATIPMDSVNKQLVDWVKFSLEANPEAQLAIKGDAKAQYPKFKALVTDLNKEEMAEVQVQEKGGKGGKSNFDNGSVEGEGTLKTTVTFVVERDGSLTDIKASGANSDFNREAERTIRSIKGKWKPGKLNGEPVRSRFKFPVTMNFE